MVDLVVRIEEHYRVNRNRIVKRYTKFAGTKEAAEDIVQEAYYRALRYKDSYNSDSKFETWFSRILKNVLNHYKNVEKGGSYEEFDEEVVEGIEFCGYNRVLLEQIRNEIFSYGDDSQEVLSLYFKWGYSPREISQIVDMKYKAIEQSIYRFKVSIREKYGEGMGS